MKAYGLYNSLSQLARSGNLNLDFGNLAEGCRRSPKCPAPSLRGCLKRFRGSYTFDVQFFQRFFNVIKLKRFNYGFDQNHDKVFTIVRNELRSGVSLWLTSRATFQALLCPEI